MKAELDVRKPYEKYVVVFCKPGYQISATYYRGGLGDPTCHIPGRCRCQAFKHNRLLSLGGGLRGESTKISFGPEIILTTVDLTNGILFGVLSEDKVKIKVCIIGGSIVSKSII